MKSWWKTSGWMIVYPLVATLVAFLVLLGMYFLAFKATAASSTLDCGPEGIPALEGRACIDREPVMVTYP